MSKSADTRDFSMRLIQPKRLSNRWKRPSWMPAGMASGIFVLTTTTSTRLVPRNVRMEKSLLSHRAFVLSLKSERMKGSALRQCSLLKNILILNMASCFYSRLITDIMWSLVKSLLIHQDTRRMPASSATTILGFL